ncbi:MAG: hypothetical protein KIT13_01825 [Burkholderiales bacterium]|nr:hypothetical protein [Burkholderiales bacterium]
MPFNRTTILKILGGVLVLLSVYMLMGVLQAASLLRGVHALRNANLWGSLSLISLLLAVICFRQGQGSHLPESRRAALPVIWGTVALLAAAWLLWPVLSDIFAADICVDVGGSFDYVLSVCDMQQSQPYVSILDRQGFRLVGAFVFGVIGVGILASNFGCANAQ